MEKQKEESSYVIKRINGNRLLTIQKMVAELLGTYLLVFVGCGAAYIRKRDGITLTGVALTWALDVVAIVYAIAHISGSHINPAATIAFAVVGLFPWKQVSQPSSINPSKQPTLHSSPARLAGSAVCDLSVGGCHPRELNPSMAVPWRTCETDVNATSWDEPSERSYCDGLGDHHHFYTAVCYLRVCVGSQSIQRAGRNGYWGCSFRGCDIGRGHNWMFVEPCKEYWTSNREQELQQTMDLHHITNYWSSCRDITLLLSSTHQGA
ncbi:hypothetical protein HPP92_005678 [Vanilla planifolia]|uniref:Uncharacterized protein n=1 Tax=Vanilla planifolia TaxID=51239 RepID=A0A835RSL3_VANPL|nr:hypothetical protein HPP92_005678 [Vanilla planifolia]